MLEREWSLSPSRVFRSTKVADGLTACTVQGRRLKRAEPGIIRTFRGASWAALEAELNPFEFENVKRPGAGLTPIVVLYRRHEDLCEVLEQAHRGVIRSLLNISTAEAV